MNAGHFYAPETMPCLVNCSFIVDSTNGNGLGIRSLKGPYIQNVYMHTSATPAAGNPNPASGTIVVQFQDNYNRSICGFNANVSPLSGSNLAVNGSALTPGVGYVITVLGTSTAADWHALGVPAGVTPAVGVSFIALLAGSGAGSGQVQISAAAGTGIMSIETLGDPNLSIAPAKGVGQNFGAQMILQCRNNSAAIAAPANGSVISLSFYLSNSSVSVQGE